MTGWKEIWKARGERSKNAKAHLVGFYNKKGELLKGELFIEKEYPSGRAVVISICVNKEQLTILCRVLKIDLGVT